MSIINVYSWKMSLLLELILLWVAWTVSFQICLELKNNNNKKMLCTPCNILIIFPSKKNSNYQWMNNNILAKRKKKVKLIINIVSFQISFYFYVRYFSYAFNWTLCAEKHWSAGSGVGLEPIKLGFFFCSFLS